LNTKSGYLNSPPGSDSDTNSHSYNKIVAIGNDGNYKPLHRTRSSTNPLRSNHSSSHHHHNHNHHQHGPHHHHHPHHNNSHSTSNHNHHHHHHHNHHHSQQNENQSDYTDNNRRYTNTFNPVSNGNSAGSGNKLRSKSNENLKAANQISSSNIKSMKDNREENNYENKISSMNSSSSSKKNSFSKVNNAFLKNHGQISQNIETSTEKKSKNHLTPHSQNVKLQSQYYQKLHQDEFADLLNFKDAALASKANKLANSTSSQQLKQLNDGNVNTNKNNMFSNNFNSKFRPLPNSSSSNSIQSNTNNRVSFFFFFYYYSYLK
jgi:hypothetical protein